MIFRVISYQFSFFKRAKKHNGCNGSAGKKCISKKRRKVTGVTGQRVKNAFQKREEK